MLDPQILHALQERNRKILNISFIFSQNKSYKEDILTILKLSNHPIYTKLSPYSPQYSTKTPHHPLDYRFSSPQRYLEKER